MPSGLIRDLLSGLPPGAARGLLRSGAWVAGGALVSVAGAAGWFWSLRKQVKQRTDALRRANAAIRENEHFLATILESLPLALFGKDASDGFRYWLWNAKAEEIYGLSRQEVLGRTDYDLYPPDLADRIRASDQVLMAEGGIRQTLEEEPLPRGEGTRQLYLLRSAIHTVDGFPHILMGTAQDITPQMRMEKDLKRSRASLAKAQALANVGNWQWEVGSNRVYWSDQMFRILGLRPGEVAPGFQEVLGRVHPEDRAVFRHSMRRMPPGQERPPVEFRLALPDGSIRIVQHNLEVERDAGGHALRLVGTFQDITDRRTTDEALRQTQKLESLGVLAGGIAHDFNNLLSAIGGNLELARLNLPPEPAASPFLTRIEKILRRASQLTLQMLAYSGKGHFVVKPINLNQVAEDMPNLLEVSISKRVALRYELDPGLHPIEADSAQIQQVIMNLVTNASEAIGDQDGVITLRTRMEHLEDPQGRVDNRGWAIAPGLYSVLEVADTGCGMGAETLRRLFDPFFTTKFSGRGLGLSAMLGILKGHQAGIRIQSRPGAGSTFTLYFPAREPGVLSESPMPAPCTARPAGGTILVVDDEPDILDACAELLESLGYRVLQARDGREALERFRADPAAIDLVLMDLTMPHMDGKEAMLAMRAVEPSVKVVICSGFNEADVARMLPYSSLAGFLQKPYTLQALKEAVRKGMEGRGDGEPRSFGG